MPNRNKKRNRRTRNRQGNQSSVVPKLRLQPYQHVTSLWVAGTDQILTTSGAGSVAVAIPINVQTIIPGFATTWQNVFDEFCILEVSFLVIPITTATGLLRMYIDENSGGLPTPSTAQGRLGITISNNSAAAPRNKFQGQLQAGHLFKWSATDVGDLSWNNVLVSPVSISYLKIYTDVTLGSPIATSIHFIRTNVRVRFRMPLQ